MKSITITPKTRICRTVDIPFAKVHDEMLALDEQAGYYYVLNETSNRVWELIPEFVVVEEICERLCQEFSVDAETCQREVLLLLHGLYEAGLIQIDEEEMER